MVRYGRDRDPIRRLQDIVRVMRNVSCCLQAQSMGAQALEALFSISQADIHAKQHSFDRAAALLGPVEEPLACSRCMQLWIAARSSAVRANMRRLQGDHPGAVQHCQAGIQLASSALQDSWQGNQVGASASSECRKAPAKRCIKHASSSSHASTSSERFSCSRGAEHKLKEGDSDEGSAPQSAWQLRSLLAQLHVSMAELLAEAGDREGSGSCLEAARDACYHSVAGAGAVPVAFPLQISAVLYQEAILQLEPQDLVSPCLRDNFVRHEAARALCGATEAVEHLSFL